MNGPELAKVVLIRALKERAENEEMLADAAYVEMRDAGSGPKAQRASAQMGKHRYAATQFRAMAKDMEETL